MAKLKIYDVRTDKMRNATQQDIDSMVHSITIMGKMVRAMRVLAPTLVPDSGPGFPQRLEAKLDEYLKLQGSGPLSS